jgi:hypothetical protein
MGSLSYKAPYSVSSDSILKHLASEGFEADPHARHKLAMPFGVVIEKLSLYKAFDGW